MEMKINQAILRRAREQRAWTQSHLAQVADLSLRTVQRIERTGDASMESASALAAALNVELASLLNVSDVLNTVSTSDQNAVIKTKGYRLLGAIGLAASALFAMGWWSTASAEQVMINLSVRAESGPSTHSTMQFINEIGTQTEIRFDQQFRLLVNARRESDDLVLSTEIYDYVNGEYQLTSAPSFLIADNESTTIHVDSTASGLLELTFNSDF